MRRIGMLALLAVCLTSAAWAQPDPNAPQPDMGNERGNARNRAVMPYLGLLLRPPTTALKATPQGLFILRNGMLAKFDGKSAKPAGQIELFDKLPEQPAENATDEQVQAFVTAMSKRLLPAAMVAQENLLVIANTERLWCVDMTTMKVKTLALPAQDQLPPAGGVAGGGGLRVTLQNVQQEAPSLEVSGQTAYLVRGNSVVAIDLGTGKVLYQAPLPEEMTPLNAQDLMRRLMGRPNPGENVRDNRGNANPGQGGQPNAPQGEVVSLVGKMHYVELEGGFWTIETNTGMKYVVTGPKVQNLTNGRKLEGMRLRLTGRVANRPGVAQYGNGYFEITGFEFLEAAN